MIMSDCGKGLVTAVNEIYPQAVHGYCCQHLAKNVETKRYSKKCKRLFWCTVFAKSDVAFNAIFVKI